MSIAATSCGAASPLISRIDDAASDAGIDAYDFHGYYSAISGDGTGSGSITSSSPSSHSTR
jgi:hypothetical protein